jgi:hypothetical protein
MVMATDCSNAQDYKGKHPLPLKRDDDVVFLHIILLPPHHPFPRRQSIRRIGSSDVILIYSLPLTEMRA